MAIKPQYYDGIQWWERKNLRNEYVEDQGNRCWHCQSPLDGKPSIDVSKKRLNMRLFPPNFLKYPIHLHHCHDTGLTIGAVHAYCNGVLWQYHGQ